MIIFKMLKKLCHVNFLKFDQENGKYKNWENITFSN